MAYPNWLVPELQQLVTEYGNWKTIYKNMGPLIEKLGKQLTQEQVYDLLYLGDESKIAACGKPKRFHALSAGYRFCGTQKNCACAKEYTVSKRRNTMIETHGVAHALQSKKIQEKSKQTNLERFGYEHAAQAPESKEKSKQTNLERFGYEHATQSPEIKEKSKRVNLEKYGFEYALSSPIIKDKIKQTNIKRFGFENPQQSPVVQNKTQETNLERYGHRNPQQSPVVQKKTQETNLERYGAITPLASPEIQERIKKTNLEKYGVENLFSCPDMKDRIKRANMDKYGFENPFYSKEMQLQIRAYNLERYGAECTFNSPEIQNKIKKTNLERYGAENPLSSPEIREKIKQTNLDRHGVEFASQAPGFQDRIRAISFEKYKAKWGDQDKLSAFINRHHANQQHIAPEALLVLLDKEDLREFAIDKSFNSMAIDLGVDASTLLRYWHNHGLPVSRSSYETEIGSFITDMGLNFSTNTRKIIKGLELDFYLPEQKIAIEFNGVYWHSSLYKTNDYHRRKYELCNELGIRLIMINEDEWLANRAAWKARLTSILGKSYKDIGARELSIRHIDKPTANDFCNEHHIQGKTGVVAHAVGAYENDNLVGVMLFNNQRGTNDIELVRFCTNGRSYAGLFSRLFKYSTKQFGFAQVLSFADLRHSIGDVYEKNGFTLAYETKPDYRYVYRDKTYHKSSFTKAQIEKKFGPQYNMMSEREAMELLNIPRIYDVGKIKFVWKA